MQKMAQLSEDRKYRFTLDRIWDETRARVTFVMLNPSTADETQDDPTIRRCIGFACSWGFGALRVVNLHPYRTKSPIELRTNSLVDGFTWRRNVRHIREAFAESAAVIYAWGCHVYRGHHWAQAWSWNWNLSEDELEKQFVLAETADLCPRHPLYLKGDLVPRRWKGWAA